MRKLFIVLTIFFISILSANALEISISVTDIPEEINLLSPKTNVERLALKATSFSLLGYMGSSEITRNSLISSYSGNSTGTKFTIYLKSNFRFSNYNPLFISDVKYSLNLCKKDDLKSIKSNSIENSISLEFISKSRESFRELISKCPIFEKKTALLFAEEFGKHTSLSSLSHFKILRFVPNKRIELARYVNNIELQSAPSRIYFIKNLEPRKALTKLRIGSIDILLTDSTSVLDLVKKDSTLHVRECEEGQFITRKSLIFDCVDFSKIEYKK